MIMINFKLSNLFKGDLVLWLVFLLLSIISIVEVYSAASTLSYKSGDFMAPLYRHVGFILAGGVLMWLVHLIHVNYLKLMPISVLPVVWVILLLALVFADKVNGAGRWLWATELAKIATIVTNARILQFTQGEKVAHPKAMGYVLFITGITALLIFPENLSSAVIVVLANICMMIIGRVSWVQLSKLFATGAICLSVFVGACFMIPKDTLKDMETMPVVHRFSTWALRIQDFSSDEDDESTFDVHGKMAQRIYADLAMQEGGVFGKGPGNSTYRDYLPQAYSDFIFSIILEEMGYVGGLVVLFLFTVLFIKSGRIARKSPSLFSSFVVAGLSIMLCMQALINVAVAVGAMPITGQPLPFVSRGGWSILSSCLMLGIIIAASRENKRMMKNKDEQM